MTESELVSHDNHNYTCTMKYIYQCEHMIWWTCG